MPKRSLPGPVEIKIESLSHDGRGITRLDGKKLFIDNALPGETVLFKYRRRRPRYDEGEAIEILSPSADRVEPPCKHFTVCGGCSLQHMEPERQIQYKQEVLLEQLRHIGKVEPQRVLPPLTGPVRGYRHKARLGVKYVIKKDMVLVGFREKRSAFIADIDGCEVLHSTAGTLIPALKALITELDAYNSIPQIEIAVDESSTVLVLRHLLELTPEDAGKLREFEERHNVIFYLQPGDEDSLVPLRERDEPALAYRPDGAVVIGFSPLDFIQVNMAMNRAMVARVLELMEADREDVVLDLFCGLGNFTLPLARSVNRITGVEGSEKLVVRARANAAYNRIINAEIRQADLYRLEGDLSFPDGQCNKILLDPPRSGAREVIERMNTENIRKLVYVSCNPATLARDAGILVGAKGFKLDCTGVMDMFPHTTHVESIAVFEK